MSEAWTKDWEDWIDNNVKANNNKSEMIKILLKQGFSPIESCEKVFGTMGLRSIPQDWLDWIDENVKRRVSLSSLYEILLGEGFYPEEVSRQLKYDPNSHLEWRNSLLMLDDDTSLSKMLDGDTSYLPSYLSLSKIKVINSKKIEHPNVLLYIIDDFLEPHLCKELCENIHKNNRRSTITNENEPDKEYRTSKTCDFDITQPMIKQVDTQICAYMGIPTERSESIQGQYYEVGNQFKQHTDWFDPYNTAEWNTYGKDMGQRTWTFMIYLNDVEEGGETNFPKLDLTISPKRGRAVVWFNIHPDGRGHPDTLHSGTPVIRGEKYIITKWFRTRGILNVPYQLNVRQQIPNYTKLGYHKTILSPSLHKYILDFYHNGINESKSTHETGFAIGNFVISGNDNPPAEFLPITKDIEERLKNECIGPLEEWSNTSLEWTATYGIRTYLRDSYLKMHTDRFKTHIISGIINIDQQVDKDWYLVIIDHYGRTHNIILKPGEELFYESARCRHGRPYPLKGDYFANVFFHTKPKDWDRYAEILDKEVSHHKISID